MASFDIPEKWQDTESLTSKTEDIGLIDLLASVGINMLIAVAGLLLFFWLRTTKQGFLYLTPKRYVWPKEIEREVSKLLLKKPNTIFSWAWKIMEWNESELLRGAGYDAVVYLRTLRLCLHIIGVYMVYALAVVLPCNYSGGYYKQMQHVRSGNSTSVDAVAVALFHNSSDEYFFRMTVSNIPPGEPGKMAPHFVGILLLTAIMMFFMHKELNFFVELRRAYLRQPYRHLRTVIVEEIPRRLRSPAELQVYFEILYPNQVEMVLPIRNLHNIETLIQARDKVLNKLEHKLLWLHRLYVANKPCRKTLEQIKLLEFVLKAASNKLNTELKKSNSKEYKASLSGFDRGISSMRIEEHLELGDLTRVQSVRRRSSLLNTVTQLPSSQEIETNARNRDLSSWPRRFSQSMPQGLRFEATSSSDESDSDDGFGDEYQDAMDEEQVDGDIEAGIEEGVQGTELVPLPKGSPSGLGDVVESLTHGLAAKDSAMLDPHAKQIDETQSTTFLSTSGAALGNEGAPEEHPGHLEGKPPYSPALQKAEMPPAPPSAHGTREAVAAQAAAPGKEAPAPPTPGHNSTGRPPTLAEAASTSAASPAASPQRSRRPGMFSSMRRFSLLNESSSSSNLSLPSIPSPFTNSSNRSSGDILHRLQASRLTTMDGDALNSKSLFDKQENVLHSSKNRPKKKPKLGAFYTGASRVRKTHPFAAKALVVFKSFTAATLAPQVLHSPDPGIMQVSSAPDERDIFWPNFLLSQVEKAPRVFIVDCIMVGVVLLFIIPATALSGVFSEDSLRTHSPRLGELADEHWSVAMLLAYVHPTILIIIINLLPPLMTGLGLFEGSLTWSRVGMRQFDRFLAFLLVNVFFATTISSSFADTLGQLIISEPRHWFLLMSSSLPHMSWFFLKYLVVKACIGMTMELNRGLAFLQMVLRFILCIPDVTKKDRLNVVIGIRRWNNPGWLPFGKIYANVCLVMLISLTFANISPLVMIGGFMWCGLASLAYRHTLLFVYEPRFETGGNFFPMVFKRLLYMLILSQTAMIGIFLVKENEFYALFTTLTLGLVLYYTFYLSSAYKNMNNLPLQYAVHLDARHDLLDAKEEQLGGGAAAVPAPEHLRTGSHIDPKSHYSGLRQPGIFGRAYVPHGPGYWDHWGETPAGTPEPRSLAVPRCSLPIMCACGSDEDRDATFAEARRVLENYELFGHENHLERQALWRKDTAAYDRPSELVGPRSRGFSTDALDPSILTRVWNTVAHGLSCSRGLKGH